MEFDQGGRLIKKDYLDTEGNSVNSKAGYSTVEYTYNKDSSASEEHIEKEGDVMYK